MKPLNPETEISFPKVTPCLWKAMMKKKKKILFWHLDFWKKNLMNLQSNGHCTLCGLYLWFPGRSDHVAQHEVNLI